MVYVGIVLSGAFAGGGYDSANDALVGGQYTQNMFLALTVIPGFVYGQGIAGLPQAGGERRSQLRIDRAEQMRRDESTLRALADAERFAFLWFRLEYDNNNKKITEGGVI